VSAIPFSFLASLVKKRKNVGIYISIYFPKKYIYKIKGKKEGEKKGRKGRNRERAVFFEPFAWI
jgi:hypothetical protein